MRATGSSTAAGASASITPSALSIREAHRFAHVAHRFRGEVSRLVAAVGDDVAHQRGIVERGLGALAQRLGLDQNLAAAAFEPAVKPVAVALRQVLLLV